MLAPLATSLFPGFKSTALTYTPDDLAFIACNPSVHFGADGKWRCILRCINYRLGVFVPAAPRTENVMIEIDPRDWSIVTATPMLDLCERARSGFCISGYEDCRLFQWKEGLWATATCCDLTRSGNREMCLLEIAPDYSFRSCRPLRGAWSVHFQKNWIPFVDGDELAFVYSLEHNIVIRESQTNPRDTSVSRPDPKWAETGRYRGSSAAVRLSGGGWLAVVHERDYRSRFVCLDPSARIEAMTDSFYFRKHDVEFSAGMALDPVTEQLVVSYSVRDATCELGLFDLPTVLSRMRPC